MTDGKLWRNIDGPLPYIGPLDERREKLGARHVRRECGSDTSGDICYSYNVLGFRGADFRSGARLTIFTFGESDAFGLGIEEAEAWPSLVVERIRGEFGLAVDELCHVNFSEPGGSNDLIARMVLSQCGAVKPDLALVNFAEADRAEGICRGRVFSIGPWFRQSQELRDQIQNLPPDASESQLFVEALHRGDNYLEFTSEEHGWLATLRNVLLVQSYLTNSGIEALATSRPLIPDQVQDDAVVGPLDAQVSPAFYQPFGFPWPPIDRSAEGIHMGPRSHARIADEVFTRLQDGGVLDTLRQRVQAAPVRDEQPSDRVRSDATNGAVGKAVRGFYEELPFSMHGDVDTAAKSVREHSLQNIYPDLHGLLAGGGVRNVLEFGCGAGWLASTMAHHYGVHVTAVDFTEAALERARQVAEALGVADRVRFVHSDLFDYRHEGPVDLVVSVGVLHHTKDCRAAFHHAQSNLGDGGSLFVGLYHEPGRRPFLERFRGLAESRGEDAALAEYAKLDGIHAGDATMLRSWFRDQVLHPHETQHTLREVCGWLEQDDLRLASTSINRFEAIDGLEALFELEQTFDQRSRKANLEEGRYFPGFFTVMARRG